MSDSRFPGHVGELHGDPSPVMGQAKQQDSFSVVDVEKNDPLNHLSDNERRIIERELSVPSIKVTYSMLFRYATRVDILILVIGTVCAAASGAVMPLMTVCTSFRSEWSAIIDNFQVVFGQFAGTFKDFFTGSVDDALFRHKLNLLSTYFVYLGVGQFVTVYISTVGFMYTAEHMTQKLRQEYLGAILGQNISFFDKIGAGEITSTITANMDLVQTGISEKLATVLRSFATMIAALIVGFVKDWRLSCVLLSVVAAIILMMGACGVFITKYSRLSLTAYSIGGAVAEEAISSIRTTVAFNGQAKLSKKYESSLIKTMQWAFRAKTSVSFMIASMMLLVFLEYGLSFWEGSRLLVAGHTNVSSTLTVLLSMLMAAQSVAHAAPHVPAFSAAIAAASNIFKVIDRPTFQDDDLKASVPGHVDGALEFRNVKHIYPSRPEVTVLEGFDLIVPPGKVTALVGSSGSGKSTIVGLVEKFYTPVDGQILLDSHDIQTLDTKWLRRQISLVSQEPVLFNCSIRRNIEHGLIGTGFEDISGGKRANLVVEAAKMANAHDFISRLPQGYETDAGAHGGLLSGGQKQRIAIARAVISNPKILLLDEATSALDSRSEGVVQAALDFAAQGRTTIVIAHRLSTIKNADNIVVLSKGHIVEQGTHDELVARKGAFFELLEAQQLTAGKEMSQRPGDGLVLTREPTGKRSTKELIASTATLNMVSDNEQEDSFWTIIKFVSAFNKPEIGIMLVGLFCAIIAGGGMPVQGVLFAKCIVSLSRPPSEYAQLRSDINFWSLMFFAVSWGVFLVMIGHGVAFEYCSGHL